MAFTGYAFYGSTSFDPLVGRLASDGEILWSGGLPANEGFLADFAEVANIRFEYTGTYGDVRSAMADIAITATVKTTDRTGVEMEALTAVSVAALTLYDMIKAVDRAARIDDIRILSKAGGRTGEWTR